MLCYTGALAVITDVDGIAPVAKQSKRPVLSKVYSIYVTRTVVFLAPYIICGTATKLI